MVQFTTDHTKRMKSQLGEQSLGKMFDLFKKMTER